MDKLGITCASWCVVINEDSVDAPIDIVPIFPASFALHSSIILDQETCNNIHASSDTHVKLELLKSHINVSNHVVVNLNKRVSRIYCFW